MEKGRESRGRNKAEIKYEMLAINERKKESRGSSWGGKNWACDMTDTRDASDSNRVTTGLGHGWATSLLASEASALASMHVKK